MTDRNDYAMVCTQIERLARDAVTAAAQPPKVERHNDRQDRYWGLRDGRWGFTEIDKPPAPRAYRMSSLNAVAEYVKNQIGGPGGPGDPGVNDPGGVAVFVRNGSVVAVLDEGAHRLERLTVAYEKSQTWRKIEEAHRSPQWVGQGSIVDLFTLELDCATQPPEIGKMLRRVKTVESSEGDVEIRAGKQAVSMKGEAMAMAGLTAPADLDRLDDVTLVGVQVYDDLFEDDKPVKFQVRAAVRTNLAKREFCLRIAAGEVARCLIEADRLIIAQIRAKLPEGVPVYAGVPN